MHSAQTNMTSELRKLESCNCAHSKADDESSIFFFQHLFYNLGKGFKFDFEKYVFLLVRRQTLAISICVLAIFPLKQTLRLNQES